MDSDAPVMKRKRRENPPSNRKTKQKYYQPTQWNRGYLKHTQGKPPLPPCPPTRRQPPNPQSAPRRDRLSRIRPCGHRRAPRRRARPARTQYGSRRAHAARAARGHCAHRRGCANVVLYLGSATGALLDRLEFVEELDPLDLVGFALEPCGALVGCCRGCSMRSF